MLLARKKLFKISIFLSIFIFGNVLNAQEKFALISINDLVIVTPLETKIKKTGQMRRYNATKDDGFYQYGISPLYTRNDSLQVVTDNVTGLIWQDDSAVVDVSLTNIPGFLSGDTGELKAEDYCVNLTLGGYTDWRTPNIDELESITDYSRTAPSINVVFNYSAHGEYFTNTSVANIQYEIFSVYGLTGKIKRMFEGQFFNIRCVRQ